VTPEEAGTRAQGSLSPNMTSEVTPSLHGRLDPGEQNDSQPPPDRQQSFQQPSPMQDLQAIPPKSEQEKVETQVVAQVADDKSPSSTNQRPMEKLPKFGILSFEEKFKRTTEKPQYNDVLARIV